MWQIWSMKGNTKWRLLIADKIIMNNIWKISPLTPGQLLFLSDLINFFIFSSVKINCHLSILWIWICFSIPASLRSLLFFNLKLWCLVPFGILWAQTDQIPLYLEKQGLEKSVKRRDDLMSNDCFYTPTSFSSASTNMDDRNLDKSYNRPRIRSSYLRPWPSGPHVSLIRADWLPRSLTSDMSALQGTVGNCDFSFFTKKKNTDGERKVRQDLTLHQLNDAEPC